MVIHMVMQEAGQVHSPYLVFPIGQPIVPPVVAPIVRPADPQWDKDGGYI